MDSPTIVHISADYPDPLVPAKTSAVKTLIDNTTGYRHVVYSLNRLSRNLGQVTATEFGPDRIALAYGAPPRGLFHLTFLERVADWIGADIRRRGLTVNGFHAHKLSVEGLIVERLARKMNRPFITNIWGDSDLRITSARPDLRRRWKAVLDEASAIIAYAPWTLDAFDARLGLDRAKTHIIPPIVTPDVFTPSPVSEGPRLVTLLNLVSWRRKNLPALIGAVAAARAGRPDIRLDIHGKGPPAAEARVRRHIAAAKAEGFVTLKGPVENSRVGQTLNAYAAFVMPTRRETFGMVFIEALFAGLPILHSRGWGVDGFFEDGVVGYACNPRDQSDILRGLEYLLDNQAALKTGLVGLNAAGGLDRFKKGHDSPTPTAPSSSGCHTRPKAPVRVRKKVESPTGISYIRASGERRHATIGPEGSWKTPRRRPPLLEDAGRPARRTGDQLAIPARAQKTARPETAEDFLQREGLLAKTPPAFSRLHGLRRQVGGQAPRGRLDRRRIHYSKPVGRRRPRGNTLR